MPCSLYILQALGARIAKLEASKRQAVAEEDYDAAKSLKLEMEKLRESFNSDQSALQSLSDSVKQVTISNLSAAVEQNSASNSYESAGAGKSERRGMERQEPLHCGLLIYE